MNAPLKPVPVNWQDTCLETQLNGPEADAPRTDEADSEIGRRINDGELELFVSCDPAVAFEQQLDRLRPRFIALHDVGSHTASLLLQAIANASGQRLQKLTIRRQGYGTSLATVSFVDLPAGAAAPLRLYSTQADASIASRLALSQLLLSYSTMGVLLVGSLAAHGLASEFKGLKDRMVGGVWSNRHLLLIPMGSTPTLVEAGATLSGGTGVAVRCAPPVARSGDVWNAIRDHWARINDLAATTAAPPLTPVPTEAHSSLRLRIMPSANDAKIPPPPTAIERYLSKVGTISGAVSCCLFELASGKVVVRPPGPPQASTNPDSMAQQGHALLTAMLAASQALGLGATSPEASITTATHHLLLRPVPREPKLGVAAVFLKTSANLTLTRAQLLRISSQLDDAANA